MHSKNKTLHTNKSNANLVSSCFYLQKELLLFGDNASGDSKMFLRQGRRKFRDWCLHRSFVYESRASGMREIAGKLVLGVGNV